MATTALGLKSLKRFLVGTPIATAQAHSERLSKKRALATFSSDCLSSIAYATEEILLVLMLAGTAVLHLSVPISISIIILLLIVVVSYRQTIYAYPNGGGAYIVAHENIGELAGLTAAAALLTDYVLTVSVSVAAGIAAVTSAFPQLQSHSVGLCLFSIAVLTVMNLRGIRESSTFFAIPTYAFVVGILIMIGVGIVRLCAGKFAHVPPSAVMAHQPLTLFLILRAFSSGCTALTGVEAVSNGIPVFKSPESRNAAITLIIMLVLSAVMFFGITFFAHHHGIVPLENETVVSQIARSIFGTSSAYYYIQFTTMGILILAANTSYADFPRLASILAKDRFLPRQLTSQGDRLVFSNGVVILGALSALLIVLFNASTHALIPLYAVGVFLSFTLSQYGMVQHWNKDRQPGWRRQIVLSAIGGTLTGVVTVVFTITKFTHGAWIITIIIPFFILLFRRIKRHYLDVGRQLSLAGVEPSFYARHPIKHTVILPVSGIHKGTIEALRYAHSLARDVRAAYVEVEASATERLQAEWVQWAKDTPLIVLKSPYRSTITPLLKYIDDVKEMEHDDVITILIPEFVTARWWQTLLHNQTALLMRAALTFKKGIIVTSVRYHLQ